MKALFAGALLGVVGFVSLAVSVKVPTWVWFTTTGTIVLWVFYRAFHDVRVERDDARAALAERAVVDVAASFTWVDGNLLRLSVENRGDEPLSDAILINLLLPRSWVLPAAGSDALGAWGPSDEDLEFDGQPTPATLWTHWESNPPAARITNQYLFPVASAPPGEYLISVRIPGYCRSDAKVTIRQDDQGE